ncbi:hypothetical protein CASFOL_003652 [Castilleja foliolosa]|uniref:Pentatricopeptide repeat-containing protein n=1 Tax=Castilleja foliolosa TaxID=1961234 RepID=A0ABD3EIE5_9LAMI
MCAKVFSPDASTLELLLDLLGTTEQNPTIFKMIQKLVPNASKQKLRAGEHFCRYNIVLVINILDEKLTGYVVSIRRNRERNLWKQCLCIKTYPQFYCLSGIIASLGMCRNGQGERALLLLDALEHKGKHLHIQYYSIVMDGLIKAKNLDAARAIFKDLTSKRLEPNVVTYSTMINGCCQNGLLEEAKDLLLKMEQTCLLPNEITYNSIIQGNLKGSRYEDAAKLFEEMDAKGFLLDASTFELLLGLLETT